MIRQTYNLVTCWRLKGTVEAVWEILSKPQHWPDWWPYVEQVEIIDPGHSDGTGAKHHHIWKTCLPYRLQFELETVRVRPPTFVKARVRGDLVGIGHCRLRCRHGLVLVRFDWHVHTSKFWMNLLAPAARPVFVWNHGRVMAAGEKKIALQLDHWSASGATDITSSTSNSDFGGGAWRHSR